MESLFKKVVNKMKVVVWKAPKFWQRILRSVFGIHKDE